jgi:hypothetical protein
VAIDKALTPTPWGTGPDDLGSDEPGVIVQIEPEEGDEPLDTEPSMPAPGHGANLAETMDETDLRALASELISLYDADEMSRSDWKKTYTKGLELLGMKVEDRTTPWPGACGVFHPLMSEAVVRFQSNAIMEIFPASGPVRVQVVGKPDREKEKQAARVKDELNYLLTERMKDYRAETERLLFNLPLSGSAFKKVYYDQATNLPCARYVAAEDMVVPYGTAELTSSERLTYILRMTHNELRKAQVNGFYVDVDIPTPMPEITNTQQKRDKISGEQPSVISDNRHTLLEMHVDLDLKGFEDRQIISADPETGENPVYGDPTGIALPYVVTIEKSSSTVLAIRRNWKEGDPSRLRVEYFVHYPYMPGFGFYGCGLVHLIGGLTKSATSILRQLVDAGTLANLPGGLKTRGLRIKGDDTPIMPGEFRDVDVPAGDIKNNIMTLPYKEPSVVLYQLLQGLVDEGRRLASITDLPIGQGNQEAPVGTTLALLERAMKVMSAVQARLHAALRRELGLIAGVVRDYMEPAYEYEQEGEFDRKQDFDDRVDIIPVSDPNAASMAQRIVKYQAALQLASQAPAIYDMAELHREVLHEIGIKNVDKVLPDKNDMKPLDPVSENMAILTGKPSRAFLAQDHEAHIKVHMSFAMDPKIQGLVGQSPQAAMIQGAMAAHVAEHVAFQYRREIEKQLGVELPPPGEPLPEDVEVRLSKLAADAAERVLQKDQNEAKAQQIAQNLEDPVLQAQLAELEIKRDEIERKAAKDIADIAIKKRQVEAKIALDTKRLQLEGEYIHAEIAASAAEAQLDRQTRVIEGAMQSATQIGTAQINAKARKQAPKKDK